MNHNLLIDLATFAGLILLCLFIAWRMAQAAPEVRDDSEIFNAQSSFPGTIQAKRDLISGGVIPSCDGADSKVGILSSAELAASAGTLLTHADLRELYHDLDLLHEDFRALGYDLSHVSKVKSQVARRIFQ